MFVTISARMRACFFAERAFCRHATRRRLGPANANRSAEDQMGYRMMGWAHAEFGHWWARLREQSGQGTVEYVGLIMLLAGLLAAVVVASKGDAGGVAQKGPGHGKGAID